MLTLKHNITFLIGCLLVFVPAAHAQVGFNSGTPISQDEGRFLEFNNLVSVNFLKDSTQTYAIQEDETLLLERSSHYVYDIQGFEQYRVIKEVRNGIWGNEALIEFSYNFMQLVSERSEFAWEKETEEWSPQRLTHFEYNNFDQATEILEKIRIDDMWVNESKRTFKYSLNRLVEEETFFVWVQDNEEWLAQTRTLFTYNAHDDIELEMIQEWNDATSMWVNKVSREFEYNEEKLIVLSTRSVWENGSWVKSSVLELKYNADGQLEETQRSLVENNQTSSALYSETANYSDEGYLGETILSAWDDENGWEAYQKEVHYWSEHYNGKLLGDDNEIDCQFVNPYLLGLPWFCDNLKEDVNYTIEVFDIYGRSFYQSQISNNASFRLSGNIPPGLYNVVIQGGLDRHTEKVLIRN
jgi:hypothetical protein